LVLVEFESGGVNIGDGAFVALLVDIAVNADDTITSPCSSKVNCPPLSNNNGSSEISNGFFVKMGFTDFILTSFE